MAVGHIALRTVYRRNLIDRDRHLQNSLIKQSALKNTATSQIEKRSSLILKIQRPLRLKNVPRSY